MADAAWKQFERDAAALFGASRFWANSGESIDLEGLNVVGQAKLVKRLSLEALTQLAEQAQRDGDVKKKAGVVAVKVRRGSGRASPMLVVMTETSWRLMHGEQA